MPLANVAYASTVNTRAIGSDRINEGFFMLDGILIKGTTARLARIVIALARIRSRRVGPGSSPACNARAILAS